MPCCPLPFPSPSLRHNRNHPRRNMPLRRSQRRAKPALSVRAEPTPPDDDKENEVAMRESGSLSGKDETSTSDTGKVLPEKDKIAAVHTSRQPRRAASKLLHSKTALVSDEEDEASSAHGPASFASERERELTATAIDIGDIDEIQEASPRATAAAPVERGADGETTNRTPLAVLQPEQVSPLRPKKVTYGKRRRVHLIEMPTSHALGVMRYASPERTAEGKSDQSEQGEEAVEKKEDEEEEEEEEEEEASPERSKPLEEFMKEQRDLWAEVDAVDLEEQFD
ncbi:unnamed protein product [Chondrus crispus]|uniref:Uncharacterized protein n=1 Tax=Chondrus crispus TaxID=2769 RepID=R7QQ30_CHOCR|nr:unnamed protein product [Chondrus crispus]CDF39581.1 unnamed protein product [Chondrus crispus]|eukprot:XP_005709875.1 unnamed protein product [Chondrus crispus]